MANLKVISSSATLNQQGDGGNKRMALFPGPSIYVTSDDDYLKRYFHDNVLHWQWPSILDFNGMYMYHYPDRNICYGQYITVHLYGNLSSLEPCSDDQLHNF